MLNSRYSEATTSWTASARAVVCVVIPQLQDCPANCIEYPGVWGESVNEREGISHGHGHRCTTTTLEQTAITGLTAVDICRVLRRHGIVFFPHRCSNSTSRFEVRRSFLGICSISCYPQGLICSFSTFRLSLNPDPRAQPQPLHPQST